MKFIKGSNMRIFIILGLLALILVGCDDDDCPVCPEPQLETEYIGFMSAYDTVNDKSILLTIDVNNDSIIDSSEISIFYRNYQFTPDKQKLFALQTDDQSRSFLNVYDPYTKQVDDSIYFPDNVYGIIIDKIRNKAIFPGQFTNYIFDIGNFTVEDSFNVDFYWETFDTSNGIFYLTFDDKPSNLVFKYDYISKTMIDSIFVTDSLGNGVIIYDMLPVSEVDRLYVIGRFGSYSIFAIVDAGTGIIVSASVLVSPFGVINRCGNYVYSTDPGREFFGESGSFIITITDIYNDQLVGWLSTKTNNVQVDAAYLRFSPDGRYMYAFGERLPWVLKYSLYNLEISEVGQRFSDYRLYDIQIIENSDL